MKFGLKRSNMRVLQIGRSGYLDGYFERDVVRFDTSSFGGRSSKAPNGLRELYSAVFGERFDLIVCEPNYLAPYDLRALSRVIFSRRMLAEGASITRPFGKQLLRGSRLPFVVLDTEDNASINRCDHYLLKRCMLYFKRELPVDEWKLFSHTLSSGLPSRRFRGNSQLKGLLGKMRPISLGIAPEMEALLPSIEPNPKTVDVFFAGAVEGLPERERGIAELRRLSGSGVVIDIPDRRLERMEFYRRCAQAHLVWSPEGYGWDCFRHHEAAACGSVPMINYPSIRPYKPMEDGVHCFYYSSEVGALSKTIRQALGDKSRLATMSAAARDHALTHHRRASIGRHIIDAALHSLSHAPAGR